VSLGDILHFTRRGKSMNTSKCPVCDWAINDGGIKVTVAGKEITVCCDECVQKAHENPSQYAAVE
jgi:ribosome-binding protein aMBF1 (putative translation factor)